MKILISAVALATALAAAAPAAAAPVLVRTDANLRAAPFDITFQGVTFTLSATSSAFTPLVVQNSAGGAFSSFGGFLGIPVRPSTFFTNRGTVRFGPAPEVFGAYASFLSPAQPNSSNGENFIGLRATVGTDNFYGFAFTTGGILNGYGFETAANTAITATTQIAAVPEPATWGLMLVGFAMVGAGVRYRRRSTGVAYA